MVKTSTMAVIAVNVLLGVLVPLALLLFFKKRYGAKVKSFFVGCAVMLLFALVLERMVHGVVLGSAAGAVIWGNIWLYGLYGGLMAGIFEETGRLAAMRFVLKKERDNDHNALMYGAGHGGFEMFAVMSLAMVNNLVYAVMINSGQTELILSQLDEASKAVMQQTIAALIATPAWQFAVSPVERLAAVTAHMGLSVLVWFSLSKKKGSGRLYLLAILLHAFLDMASAVIAGLGVPILIVELVVWAIAIGIALIAKKVWKTYSEPREACLEEAQPAPAE